MKTDLFQSCGHCWVFQICWHIKGSTFTASSFRIWNSSTGIPSLPIALFVVILPKTHLTSHSRMSGFRWGDHTIMVIQVLRPFFFFFPFYSSSVYSEMVMTTEAEGHGHGFSPPLIKWMLLKALVPKVVPSPSFSSQTFSMHIFWWNCTLLPQITTICSLTFQYFPGMTSI